MKARDIAILLTIAAVLTCGAHSAFAKPVPVIELDAAAKDAGQTWVRIDLGDGQGLRPLPDVHGANVTPRVGKPGALDVFLSLRASKVRLLNSDGSEGMVKVVHPESVLVQMGDALEPAISLPDEMEDVPEFAVPEGTQWKKDFVPWVRGYVPLYDPAEHAGLDGQARLKATFLYLSDTAAPVGAPAGLYRKMWILEAMRAGKVQEAEQAVMEK